MNKFIKRIDKEVFNYAAFLVAVAVYLGTRIKDFVSSVIYDLKHQSSKDKNV